MANGGTANGDAKGQREDFRLGGHAAAVQARLERFTADAFGERLWQKDPTLWSAEPVPELADRMGWLDLPVSAVATLPELARLVAEVGEEGQRGFRAGFPAPPEVGGRYSAFTPFGLVPGALAGVDLAELLARGGLRRRPLLRRLAVPPSGWVLADRQASFGGCKSSWNSEAADASAMIKADHEVYSPRFT